MRNEFIILIVAASPITELRGSIPLGLFLKEPLLKILMLSLLGNILPIIPLLFLLKPISERLRHFYFFKRFFDWLFEKTRQKAKIIEKYEALGLVIFVGIPLPMTGAWTGCIAASLFKIRFRYAFLSIVMGVIMAGIIVSILSVLGIITYKSLR